MEYLIGIGAAVAVCAFGTLAGFDRNRVFYPTVLIVVAHYYILYAVIGNSMQALAAESAVAVAFWALAVVGFKRSLWVAAAALAGHGVFDLFHGLVIQNPGLPIWWPGFCLGFDVPAGAFLALLLIRRSELARSAVQAARP